MKEKFYIEGFFYQLGEYNFRKYLDIKAKDSKIVRPDLMVVMMNPGSSRPQDGNDNSCVVSEAVPDNTQCQIMRVMEKCNYKYARVLNLSDLRTPDSKELYKFIKSENSTKVNHSIFCDDRKEDFDSLYIKNVPVIYGWGVDTALTNLAKSAVERIKHPRPAGLKKDGVNYAYYHPFQRTHNKRVEWVDKISKMLQCT